MAVPDHVERTLRGKGAGVIMDHQENSPEKLYAFLAALSELSAEYGIGISGTPVLFLMEKDDHMFSYRADEASNLTLG
jgi:hypothetical protein